MAAHYRDQNNKEWEKLKLCKRSLLQILKTGKFDNENIYELENIISCFSKFKLCSFCQFVFKKDGLLQHENYCKIKLRSKLYSLPIVETPDEIFKSNIKIFAPIADLIPKTYDSLRECLNEDNYVKTYLKVYTMYHRIKNTIYSFQMDFFHFSINNMLLMHRTTTQIK